MKCYNSESNMSEIFGICDYSNIDEISKSILCEKIISFNTKEFIFDLHLPSCNENIYEVEFLRGSINILHQKVFYTPACYNLENISTSPKAIMNLQNELSTGKSLNIICNSSFSIQYVSNEFTQQLFSFHSNQLFSMNINLLPFSNLNDKYNISTCINDISILEVFSNSIRVSLTVTMQAIPYFDECDDYTLDELASTYHGGISDLNTITNFVKNINENHWSEFTLSESIQLDCSLPPIYRLIKTMSSIDVISHKIILTPKSLDRSFSNKYISGKKLLINLNFKCKIMYSSNEAENSIHSDIFIIPLSVFVVINEKTQLSTKFLIDTCIENIAVMLTSEHSLFISASIFTKLTPLNPLKPCNS